ncbi:MAG: polymer-forming cytoskeletal protein [Chitinophagaceae bacterium]|nr:MAG: polymer-forming cytoskeletal protein [Chitinophagaceae bacterium]
MFNKNNTKAEKTNIDNLPISTILDENISLKGDITGEGAIRIDGKVEGNIDLNKGIILGEKAEVTGTLKSNIIVVHGKLYGNLNCQQLFIKSTGLIDGDIEVDAFEVEMGGKYNGHLQMKDRISKDEKVIKLAEGAK